MATSLCSLTLVLFLVAADDSVKPRKPHPLAPSLVELTEEEEAKLDAIIDRFILADTGKLRGAEALKAMKEFEALGPDAIPALLRGLNKAAEIEHSCPALVIAKKLSKLLNASKDVDLLDYARQEMGAGVEASRHKGIIGDLRVTIATRRNALLRQGITSNGPQIMATPQLIDAVGKEKGAKLRPLMAELATRKGDEPLKAFVGVAESSDDKEIQQLARNLLTQRVASETATKLRERSKESSAELRLAALTALIKRNPIPGDVLIERLTDSDERVRDLAHKTLVLLNRGVDYGPKKDDSGLEIEKAVEQWLLWWKKNNKK